MSKFGCFAAFAVGAGISGGLTWYFTKKYYEGVAQKEIDQVVSHFNEKDKQREEVLKDISESRSQKPDLEEYMKVVRENGYSNPEEKEEVKEKDERPYPILGVHYGEYEDYKQVELTYYSDGVLCDDNDIPINEDPESIIPEDFEEIRNSSVIEEEDGHEYLYLREEERKIDYKILLGEAEFSDE